ncbi:MAG: preprotein translocase subunit SecG [Pseudomonadota bacterium]
MTTVLLIIHLLVATGLVTVVLMQRSEGGALGIGGGGPGGMMSGRGAANLLTRLTMILGAIFIANSILLAIVQGVDSEGRSVFDRTGEAEQADDGIGLPIQFDEEGDEAPTIDAPAEEGGDDTPQVPPGR